MSWKGLQLASVSWTRNTCKSCLPRHPPDFLSVTVLGLMGMRSSGTMPELRYNPAYMHRGRKFCPSRPLLANLAAANTEKEAMCRSILLSLQPESQSKSCQWRISYVLARSCEATAILLHIVLVTFCRGIPAYQSLNHYY